MNERIKQIEQETKQNEETQRVLKEEIDALVSQIGNIVHDSVPVSKDEAHNQVIARWGECRREEGLLNHHHLLTMIGGYEPERGVNVAGHRAYFLRDAGVLLNQALINYGIAFLRKRQYSILQPPYFMNKDVMAGVAQLSEFNEALYHVQGEDEKYLIATSEQPICAFHKGEWLQENQLPLRYAGISTCFRKESGSHGKDTWGIFRVHQFEKVEQFVICDGDIEVSNRMHEEMLQTAQEFYQSLGLPYHVVNIVSGELNNAAIKKYDLEGWFPGYNSYRELVSCSNCTDYQSRSMEIRCGTKKMNEKSKKYVHMLNATLCATTRTICCILENYQTPTGINIPEVLVPFMGGITFLPFIREKPSDGTDSKTQEAAAAKPKKGKDINNNNKKQPAKAAAPTPAPAAPAPAAPAAAAAAPAPAAAPSQPAAVPAGAEAIVQAITAKGDQIRELKAKKVSAEELQQHIDELLRLKAQYKDATGTEYIAPNTQGSSKKKKKEAAAATGGAAAPAPAKKAAAPAPAPAPAKAAKAAAAGGVDLAQLNEVLTTQSFMSGFQPTQEDVRTLAQLTGGAATRNAAMTWKSSAPLRDYPALARWVDFMIVQHEAEMARWA
jgi:seryl-tRNA synthetase